jgi:hypothetical protein
MHCGKTYWSIQIDTRTLQEKTPKEEYTPLRKKLQLDLKTALNNKTAYATEKAAIQALGKLSDDLQGVSYIAETTPIHGIF